MGVQEQEFSGYGNRKSQNLGKGNSRDFENGKGIKQIHAQNMGMGIINIIIINIKKILNHLLNPMTP